MRRQRRAIKLLAVLLSFGLVASACSNGDDGNETTTPTVTDASVPKGGTLVVGAEQEPDCMDWIGTCSGSSWGYWMVAVQHDAESLRHRRRTARATTSTSRASLLTGEPKLETEPGPEGHLRDQPEGGVERRHARSRSADFKYTWDQIANRADVYDKTGYDLIAGVDDSDPTHGRGHVQAGRDLRRLEGPVHRRTTASSRATSSRARTATPR